ncbi:actin cytoskeleton-regulatory complex protein PAN1-like isoform X2 [Peromyscus leucopus]|uniref:actin cytoskeleton-regulatory complex protein PAN1-like isoform X2 n=1 Tax=Peromyscus leucopus TaxID=10041 RepID=UPI001885180D|nr:actin cytoskeleton-regulatory complex protein PAN1-like isoform X2 [Peromyscus leucopus]
MSVSPRMPLVGRRRTAGTGTTPRPSLPKVVHLLPPPSSLVLPPPPPPRSGLPAQGEPGRVVTRRPLVAEEAPVRRLGAPDKSGAGESGAVTMEEQETEEVRGRSRRKKCSHRQRRLLPPCTGLALNLSCS